MAALSALLLQQLAYQRLAEAKSLYQSGHYSGAWYIGGYVLELALKAAVCKTLQVADYPDAALGGRAFKTHAVDDLVLLAGLQAQLALELRDDAFRQSWSIVTDWEPGDRYSGSRTQQDVDDLLTAYEDATRGVMAWLTRQW